MSYENKIGVTYRAKAIESFKTKLDLFLFDHCLNEESKIEWTDFNEFKIEAEIVRIYTTEFWQQLTNYELTNKKKEKKKISDVNAKWYEFRGKNTNLKNVFDEWQEKYIKEVFSKIFPESEFNELIKIKHCQYCEISESQIDKLGEEKRIFKKSFRGWKIEIDRKNSNYEYTPENCVRACYWCNNAKTDEFTPEEFKKVGEVIKTIWQERKEIKDSNVE